MLKTIKKDRQDLVSEYIIKKYNVDFYIFFNCIIYCFVRIRYYIKKEK
jgi:hypothetical protein